MIKSFPVWPCNMVPCEFLLFLLLLPSLLSVFHIWNGQIWTNLWVEYRVLLWIMAHFNLSFFLPNFFSDKSFIWLLIGVTLWTIFHNQLQLSKLSIYMIIYSPTVSYSHIYYDFSCLFLVTASLSPCCRSVRQMSGLVKMWNLFLEDRTISLCKLKKKKSLKVTLTKIELYIKETGMSYYNRK